MKVLCIPDSFKGSISSLDAALAIREGWLSLRPGDEVVIQPFADGGEGSMEAISYSRGGEYVSVRAHDPHLDLVDSKWLLLDSGLAVIEMAEICGLSRVPLNKPIESSSYGLGELIKSALLHPKVREIYICLGGTATSDGGIGALSSLGFRFINEEGQDFTASLHSVGHIKRIEGPKDLPPKPLKCLTDVTSPLLGPNGAASMFSPQKGANKHDVLIIENSLAEFAKFSDLSPDFEGAGAAGGTAFGLCSFLGATIEPGANRIADLIGLSYRFSNAELVITGEGKFDSQSKMGKLTQFISQNAHAKPVICICGVATISIDVFTEIIQLTNIAPSIDESIQNPKPYLTKAGELAAEFVLKKSQSI